MGVAFRHVVVVFGLVVGRSVDDVLQPEELIVNIFLFSVLDTGVFGVGVVGVVLHQLSGRYRFAVASFVPSHLGTEDGPVVFEEDGQQDGLVDGEVVDCSAEGVDVEGAFFGGEGDCGVCVGWVGESVVGRGFVD